jgi:hypothetical protein
LEKRIRVTDVAVFAAVNDKVTAAWAVLFAPSSIKIVPVKVGVMVVAEVQPMRAVHREAMARTRRAAGLLSDDRIFLPWL